MNKETITQILSPFINGEVPQNKRDWSKAINRAAKQVRPEETAQAISVLEGMYRDYTNPESTPADEIPGAHGLYQVLTARQAFS